MKLKRVKINWDEGKLHRLQKVFYQTSHISRGGLRRFQLTEVWRKYIADKVMESKMQWLIKRKKERNQRPFMTKGVEKNRQSSVRVDGDRYTTSGSKYGGRVRKRGTCMTGRRATSKCLGSRDYRLLYFRTPPLDGKRLFYIRYVALCIGIFKKMTFYKN